MYKHDFRYILLDCLTMRRSVLFVKSRLVEVFGQWVSDTKLQLLSMAIKSFGH